jgi:hypothetical protein
MERQINQKIEQYQLSFKKNIKQWLEERNVSFVVPSQASASQNLIGEFLQYIYDYNNIVLTDADLKKRKRIKNSVPQFELCIAKRANGEQCTRRKKIDEDPATTFCGTHTKGTPHGIIENDVELKPAGHKVEVWVKDIQGINYYIDSQHNVYKPEDILSNKPNPAVIATWTKITDDVYSIPQFGI